MVNDESRGRPESADPTPLRAEELEHLAHEAEALVAAAQAGQGSLRVNEALLATDCAPVARVARALEALAGELGDKASLASRVDDFHESTMELALGLSEAFEVLAALRSGHLDARAGEQMLRSKHELVAKLAQAINATAAEQADVIRRQEHAIQELSNPILRIWDNVLAVPIMGIVDSSRTADIMDRLLAEVVRTQSKCIIIDITGVDVVDTRTADNFIKMVKAAELVGARCVLTGISPAVAQTLVDIGVDLGSVLTLRNLEDGLRECMRFLESRRTATRG